MAEKRMTKREKFELALVREKARPDCNDELVALFEAEIKSLSEKSKARSDASKVKAEAREAMYPTYLDALKAIGPCRVTELVTSGRVGTVSTSMATYILRELLSMNKVIAYKEKGQTLYKVAE